MTAKPGARSPLSEDIPLAANAVADGSVVTGRLPAGALTALLAEYSRALAMLDTEGVPDLPLNLIATLRLRDEIAAHLETDRRVSAREVVALAELDRTLKSLAVRVERTLGVAALKDLSATASRKRDAWWWNLDRSLPRPLFVWTALTALCFTATVSLLAEVARRFFAEGPDFAGALYTLVQALLALAAGGTLVSAGSERLEGLLDSIRVRRRNHGRIQAMFALSTTLVALAGYWSLPLVARSYNDSGVKHTNAGDYSLAIQDFRRALSLSPDFPQAHYSLGRAHESVLEFDSAAREYQKAIEIDRQLYLAYNSLARLYIVHKNDPASALGLIDRALELQPGETSSESAATQGRFALLKNRGWANLQLGNLIQARVDLASAEQVIPNRAATSCLLAQVEEKQRSVKDSAYWDRCLGRSFGATDVEPAWISTAQDRLQAREEQR